MSAPNFKQVNDRLEALFNFIDLGEIGPAEISRRSCGRTRKSVVSSTPSTAGLQMAIRSSGLLGSNSDLVKVGIMRCRMLPTASRAK